VFPVRTRHLVLGAAALSALPVLALVGVNVFLNIWLPVILNRQPERLHIGYDFAWMLIPGEVRVRSLRIRAQGPADQWLLEVDRVSGTVDLAALRAGRFAAHTLRGKGASFRYRRRLDAPLPPGASAPPVPADLTSLPPIFGLANPPDPSPEARYGPPAHAVPIDLDDIVVADLREAWLGDYRYEGVGIVSGSLSVQAGDHLEVRDALVKLGSGTVHLGGTPVVNRIHGQVAMSIARVNPLAQPGTSLYGFVTARATLDAEVQDLGFLGFYLGEAPWLKLSGGLGDVGLDVTLHDGRFAVGSRAQVESDDLVAKLMSYVVTGDGLVELEVTEEDQRPESRIAVSFSDYAITHAGDTAPHVRGKGLSVTARSPDVALDRPFSGLEVTLDLPEAEIPDVGVYNAYLPRELGFTLLDGTGHIHGRLVATTPDDHLHGEVVVTGAGVEAKLDGLTIKGDLALHARLVDGSLDDGRYDISGSRLDLENVGIVDATASVGAQPHHAASKAWWAGISLPAGSVHVGAPMFLDASLDLRFRDSVPFVTIFSERTPIAAWIQDALAIEDLTGSAHIQLGDELLHLPSFTLRGGKDYELLLRLRRKRAEYLGVLYARYGALSVGVELLGAQNKVHVLGARKWFDAQ
jgi:hypothetical protein